MNYEITVTVSPIHNVSGERYGKMIASKQWEFLQFYIYQTLKRYDVEYSLYPEFHKNLNIHVHGHAIIPITLNKMDIVDIHKRLNQLGRSNFKLVNNLDNWLKYIKKDFDELGYSYNSPNYRGASMIPDPLSTTLPLLSSLPPMAPQEPRSEATSSITDLIY